MKTSLSIVLLACLMCGCEGMQGAIAHDDSMAAVPRDQGPTLCRDGSVPPCTPRD